MKAFYLSIALCVIGHRSTFLDAKCGAQLFHEGGSEVCSTVTENLSRHPKHHYKPLVKYSCDGLGVLVLGYHGHSIMGEVIGDDEDILDTGGLLSSMVDSILVKSMWTSLNSAWAQIGHRGALDITPLKALHR